MSLKDRFSKAINAFLDGDKESLPTDNRSRETSREEEEYVNSVDKCIEKGPGLKLLWLTNLVESIFLWWSRLRILTGSMTCMWNRILGRI